MLYTHAWGIFFGVGAALALIPVWANAARTVAASCATRLLAFGAAGGAVPALAADAALPGDAHRLALGLGAELRRAGPDLAQPDGRRPGDRPRSCSPRRSGWPVFWTRGQRGAREALTMWALIIIPVGTLAFGWVVSRFSPAWQYRYFAPILGALLLLAALGLARARGRRPGRPGPGRHLLGQSGVVHAAEQERHARRRRRDGAPAPSAAIWSSRVSPSRCRWPGTTSRLECASPTPLVLNTDPQSMNWVHALERLRNANPAGTFAPLRC